jgi:hypothetical protein
MYDTPLRRMPWESFATFEVKLACRFLRANRALTLSVITCLLLAASARAQERVRTADAAPAIESYTRVPNAFFYYGPFQEELTGTANVQYTDNVNLTATDKISDLSFNQSLSLNTTWVISHLNQLQLLVGGGIIENFYGNGRSQVNFEISPDSKLELKFEIGSFKIRLYDRFSYTQNPTQDPTATDTANLNSLTNTMGVAVDDDLNICILTLSGDYTYNNESGTTAEGEANSATTGTRLTFRAGPKVTFRLSPTILYGVSAEATRSNSAGFANVNSLNVGPFIKGKLTREFEFDLSGGATLLDTKPAIGPGYYYTADFRYLVNRHWQLLLSGSHDLIFTTGNDLTEENVFRLGSRLDLTRAITFTLSPFVNFGDIKTNEGVAITSGQSSYTQFGVEAKLVWTPRKRWTSSLDYQFVRRESGATFGTGTVASQNYIQNTLSLSVSYSF